MDVSEGEEEKMIGEELSPGGAALGRLDPRVKIIVAVLYSVVVALSVRLPSLLFALGFSLGLLLEARLDLKEVTKRLLLVNTFILFLWFLLPISVQGTPLFRLWRFTVTREGVLYAFQVTLKSNAILGTSIALLSTTPIFSLVHAMHHMRFPDKLVHLLFFCFRYIHVMEREYHRLMNAAKARGFSPRTNLHTYRTYSYLAANLLFRGYDRSQRVYEAMLCRGFEGKYWVLHHFAFKRKDLAALLLMLGYILWLGVLEWGKVL